MESECMRDWLTPAPAVMAQPPRVGGRGSRVRRCWLLNGLREVCEQPRWQQNWLGGCRMSQSYHAVLSSELGFESFPSTHRSLYASLFPALFMNAE